MSAAKPWRSGFCGIDLPPDSHRRCTGDHIRPKDQAVLACVCDCHTQQPSPDPAHTADMPRPGVHHDVDEAIYHGDKSSLSASGAKLLANVSVSAAEFRWNLDNRTYKAAFDFGHAAHAKVLGVGNEIRVIPDDILAANGATSTKAAKEFIAQARADDAVPLKAADAAKVDAMALALKNHADAYRLLSSGEPEVSAWSPCPDTGIMRRARADLLRPNEGECVDYKTAASSVAPHEFARTAARLGYDQQDPWYRDVFTDAGVPIERFFFVAQQKEPPYAVAVHELDEPSVAHGRYLNGYASRRFAEHTASGDWPGHTGINLIATPTWRRLYDPESLTAADTIPDDFTWSPDD